MVTVQYSGHAVATFPLLCARSSGTFSLTNQRSKWLDSLLVIAVSSAASARRDLASQGSQLKNAITKA
jgi:hypothetical protein